MANYELWIDESGDFKDEMGKKQRRQNPSLIGGILIKQQDIAAINFSTLLDSERNHATELSGEDKVNYVLPVLESLVENYHATPVIFENTKYVDLDNNRELYLRMMAEGLLQLLLRLNAVYEDVKLNVLIARRQDVETRDGNRVIQNQEYIRALRECIEKKRKERRLILSDGTSLSFTIDIANNKKKLQLADFVCNTRLTRNSNAFSGVKDRIENLFGSAYLFTLSEVSSENYIKQCLTQNMVSDALIELITTRDKIDRKKNLNLIFEKMRNCSYRIQKSQLRQFETDLLAYVSLEDDYERGEKLLKEVNEKIMPGIMTFGNNFREFQVRMMLYLADMYLREGAILECKDCMEECVEIGKGMHNSLENLLLYYQIQEKLALYAIDSFQFERADFIMGHCVASFENIISAVEQDEFLSDCFSTCVSEYYGDALCMEIYAMMFLQRAKPELYKKLCVLSDIALKQYPRNEGELERHRQYRSHIELEAGKFEEALMYLMAAKTYLWETPTEECICNFLDEVTDTEMNISCQYYLMYYMLIMCRAELQGSSLAQLMHDSLIAQKRLLEKTGILVQTQMFSNKINLQQDKGNNIYYHPMEIIYWKFASFYRLFNNGEKTKIAKEYFQKALDMCFKYDNYVTMQITGIGIWSEYIYMLTQNGESAEAEKQLHILEKKMEKILELELEDDTRQYVLKLQEQINNKCFFEASELVTY